MTTRKEYYNNLSVQYELIRLHKYRETFLLPYDPIEKKSSKPIRWLKCDCIKFMKKNWEQYGFLDRPMNLYHSMATYDHLPVFSWNWRIKSQQQQIWLEKFQDYLTKLDLFIETDSKDLTKSFTDAIEIKEFLDKYKILYYIGYSGSKGCHIIVPYEEFAFLGIPVYNDKKERHFVLFDKFLAELPAKRDKVAEVFDLVLLFKSINMRMKGILALDTLDSSVSDVKRVKKTAYSWDVKSDLIALPLTDEQLYNFSTDIVKPETVLKNGVYKRGVLWRNQDVCPLKRKLGILKLLEDLYIIEK